MRMLNERRALGLLAALLFVVTVAGCAPSDPEVVTYTRGAVAANRVVAVGNSLTAGFTNGGLIIDGQVGGFANLVSRTLTGESMTMPLVAAPGIGSTGAGTLHVTALGALEYRPLTMPPTSMLLASSLPQPYDNLGVPGATTRDVTMATSSANSQSAGNLYFDLILRNSAFPGDATQLDQLRALVENGVPGAGTLILWVGNNDVLGGTLDGDPVVGTNITPSAGYQALMQPIIDAVVAMDIPQVVLVNIPPVTAIPYVTTIGGLLTQGGASPAAIGTEETDVAHILLSAQTTLLNPDFSVKPEFLRDPGTGASADSLSSEFTLTNDEADAVLAEIAAYNSYLSGVATANDWALVDAFTILASVSADPATRPNLLFPLLPDGGGAVQNVNAAFSLDGIHLSEIGNAFMANAVLDALNAEYGETFPAYDLGDFSNAVGWEDFGGVATQGFVAGDVYRELARSPLFRR